MQLRQFCHLLVLTALLACSRGMSGNGLTSFSAESQALEGETIELPSLQNAGVYHEVLRFYRPARGRMRLLDRTLLPGHRGVGEGESIEISLAESIVDRLGDSFCVSDGRQECNGRNRGGLLRVSPIYRLPDSRARVVVRFISIEPGGPATPSTQVFLLEQSDGNWKILGRR
jgi:hypothetical protein